MNYLSLVMDLFIKAVFAFGTKLLKTLATEAMVKYVFFQVARAIVDCTKTPHDNAWLDKLEKEYNSTQK